MEKPKPKRKSRSPRKKVKEAVKTEQTTETQKAEKANPSKKSTTKKNSRKSSTKSRSKEKTPAVEQKAVIKKPEPPAPVKAEVTNIQSPEAAYVPTVRIRQSVAILVDGNNIEMSIHSMLNKKKAMINFDILVPKLLKERGLNRLIYFREGKSISSKLAERLHNHYYGIVVPCHKSADIPLTIAATQIADKVDTIIILSGDADYVELVKHLTSRGVRVEIAAVAQTTASILREAADHFFAITKEHCFVLG